MRRTPVVATIHHPLAADRDTSLTRAHSILGRIGRIVWYPWVMQRWVAQRLDSVITVSEYSATALEDAYDIDGEQISIVPNGVDQDMFRPVEVAKEPGRILFVGRTEDEQKGFVYLLEALRKLRSEVPFHLTVVTRPARERTERLVDQMGLYGRVTFVENVSTEELVAEYNKAQFVVSPSLCEGFGLPAIESLSCGTPVVATTAGAFPDIIENNVSGLLVPPADACALSRAVRTLLEDPQRCRRMGAAGREHVIERYSWDRAARQTVEVYRQAIARTADAR
jgi:glycosyltransferase involved in cell wall biosynthesis